MTANLFGERYVGRAPAWHQLGKVLPDGIQDTTAGFIMAGLNYEILTVPIVAQVPTGGRPKSVEVHNRFALVREPTPDDDQYRPLGVVSGSYDVIQNMELATLLDGLGLTREWSVETAGALGEGDTIFVCYKNGESEVLGIESEHLDHYFLVTDKRDGKTSLKLAFTQYAGGGTPGSDPAHQHLSHQGAAGGDRGAHQADGRAVRRFEAHPEPV